MHGQNHIKFKMLLGVTNDKLMIFKDNGTSRFIADFSIFFPLPSFLTKEKLRICLCGDY